MVGKEIIQVMTVINWVRSEEVWNKVGDIIWELFIFNGG